MDNIILAFTLAFVTERITAAIVAPFKQQWPDWKYWWVLIYPTWVLGGLLAWASGINLAVLLVPALDPVIGRLLTAIIVGGGGNLIHDVLQRAPTQTITASTTGSGTVTATVTTPEVVPNPTDTDFGPPPG